jgi:hypothetical protein
VAGAERCRRREPDKFAQAAPYPVTLDGVADLLGNRKTDPRRRSLVTDPDLDDETRCMRSRAGAGGLGNGPKVTPAFQSLHVCVTGLASQICAIHFKRLHRYVTDYNERSSIIPDLSD